MSTAPSAEEQFDEKASQQLEAVYLTPDVIEQRERVLALLAPRAGEHALDIGCGPGLTTEGLAHAVGSSGSVLGVDIAQPMLTMAARRCASLPQVRFDRCDVNALSAADERFDVALASQVYEYVDDIDAALTELSRVIRPGGGQCWSIPTGNPLSGPVAMRRACAGCWKPGMSTYRIRNCHAR